MRYLLCFLALAFTARAELKTDIEFARPGGVGLTLDAFVPDGAGPFPTCILIHGGGKWNAYDMVFRAARFQDGKLTEKAMVSMYFNGQKVHQNVRINQVWGGPNSGIDGGHDGGKGITDTPQGLKLQAEGHDVRYRNAWIKERDLKESDTDF